MRLPGATGYRSLSDCVRVDTRVELRIPSVRPDTAPTALSEASLDVAMLRTSVREPFKSISETYAWHTIEVNAKIHVTIPTPDASDEKSTP